MMNKLLPIALITGCFAFTNAHAQLRPHSVKLYLLNSYVTQAPERAGNNSSLAGISYDYKVSQKFGLGGRYSAWTYHDVNFGLNQHLPYIATEQLQGNSSMVGKLMYREAYSFYDVFALVNLSPFKRHYFLLKAGPSVANGRNTYVQSYEPVTNNLEQPDYCFTVNTLETREARETTVGAVAEASYEYLLWQERIAIGADIGVRKYHAFPLHYNFGFHVGYQFGLR